MKLMLNAADTPNFETINVNGMNYINCLLFIVYNSITEPINDIKYIEQNPNLGPVFK